MSKDCSLVESVILNSHVSLVASVIPMETLTSSPGEIVIVVIGRES